MPDPGCVGQQCGVVLLLGSPGTGKSLLGAALLHAHCSSIHAFVNVGEQLRSTGKVDAYMQHPTAARKLELHSLARDILGNACRDLCAAAAAAAAQHAAKNIGSNRAAWPLVLLVECVKELQDAFTLMELLQEHNLPLLQVLYLPDDGATTKRLRKHLQLTRHPELHGNSVHWEQRDASRCVEARQDKWRLNAGLLIEFLASQGVLVEVAAAPGAATAAAKSSRDGMSRGHELPSLAAIGYAAGCSSGCSRGCSTVTDTALWASDWLRSHANTAALQPGWTYMFEAIYQANTHVVQYPFEGLVLLEAVSPQGLELADTAARQQLAQQLGVLAVPSFEGAFPELSARLARGCSSSQGSQDAADRSSCSSYASTATASLTLGYSSSGSGARERQQQQRRPACFEGWVVQSRGPAAAGMRCKLVLEAFVQASRAAGHLLHPLAVWDAVFCGASHAQLAAGLPGHFLRELDAILTALDSQFWFVQHELHAELQQVWLRGGAAAAALAAQPGWQCVPGEDEAAAAAAATAGSPPGLIAVISGHASLAAASEGARAQAAGAELTPTGSTAESAAATVATAAAAAEAEAIDAGQFSVETAMHPAGAGAAAAAATASSDAESATATGTSSSSSTGSSSQSSLPNSVAFGDALAYAVYKGSAFVPSMFRIQRAGSGSTAAMPAPALRGLILECIRPRPDGCLIRLGPDRPDNSPDSVLSYTPSPAFQQTYAKGWAKGPREGRVSVLAPEPLVLVQLTDQATMSVLSRLQGRDVGRAMLVCRAWRQLIQGDPGFGAQAQQAAAARRQRWGGLSARSSSDWEYDGGPALSTMMITDMIITVGTATADMAVLEVQCVFSLVCDAEAQCSGCSSCTGSPPVSLLASAWVAQYHMHIV